MVRTRAPKIPYMWTIAGSEALTAPAYDALTRLPNHQALAAALPKMVDAPALHHDIGALVLLDVDHFHLTNEVLGHAVGDKLLRDIAAGLRSWASGRCVLARTGADEFAIALTTEAGADLHAIAAEVVAGLATVCAPHSPRFSVGISSFDLGRAPTADALLKCASAALRDAKDDGGGRVVRYGIGERHGADGAEWVARAVTEDRLMVVAQPIVDVRTGAVLRRELLVRALDSDGQVVMPGAFIPVAERFGLMPAVDRWVVARALMFAAAEHRVSVNLSAHSLSDIRPLAALIESYVERGGDPVNLMFEVTETAAIADLSAGLTGLRALAALGCPLALDDFGAGFGCFSYLKHVPAQVVKIDREFIRDICSDTSDLAITTAITRLARELGMEVVAEGIEDRQTLLAVTAAGVHYAQGYFVGRPAPILAPGAEPHVRARITGRRLPGPNAARVRTP